MGEESFGALPALHAEMEGLLWAVTCLCGMQILITQIETNCPDLVHMWTRWPFPRSLLFHEPIT